MSLTQASLPGISGYLVSSYGLSSSSSLFKSLAVTILCLQELFLLYSPILYSAISFILLLKTPGGRSEADVAGESIYPSISPELAKKAEPIVLKDYRAFVDDKKAKVGSINDIKKLAKYGFDKFRYTSPSFAKLLVDGNNASPSSSKLTKSKKHKPKKEKLK